MIKYYSITSKLRYALRKYPNTKLVQANIILATLSLGVIIGYWLPAKGSADSINDQIDNIRLDIGSRMKLSEMSHLYQNTLKDVELIEQRLNSDTRQATIIDNLNRLAKHYQVRIIDSAYEEGRGKKNYQPLNHDITVEGSYVSLRNFLRAIDGLPTWTVIVESKMSLGKSNSSMVIASIRLATFRKT